MRKLLNSNGVTSSGFRIRSPRPEQENCNRSRDVLNRLNVRSRIRVRNADGSARMMDETERQERIADAQKGVAQYCK